MKRVEVLAAIDRVQTKHCDKCHLVTSEDNLSTCHSCPFGKQLKALGDHLEVGEREYQSVLNKRSAMTYKDVEYLRTLGVGWTTISKYSGVSKSELLKYMKIRKEAYEMRNEVLGI